MRTCVNDKFKRPVTKPEDLVRFSWEHKSIEVKPITIEERKQGESNMLAWLNGVVI
jgi:hypothetical protein